MIFVYSASPNKEKVLEIFKYAIGIEVRISGNVLQTRNRLMGVTEMSATDKDKDMEQRINSGDDRTCISNSGRCREYWRTSKPPLYMPSPKHDEGWGSNNPIKTQEEGQRLLDSGYRDGKQIYNVTDSREDCEISAR